MDLYT